MPILYLFLTIHHCRVSMHTVYGSVLIKIPPSVHFAKNSMKLFLKDFLEDEKTASISQRFLVIVLFCFVSHYCSMVSEELPKYLSI